MNPLVAFLRAENLSQPPPDQQPRTPDNFDSINPMATQTNPTPTPVPTHDLYPPGMAVGHWAWKRGYGHAYTEIAGASCDEEIFAPGEGPYGVAGTET